MSHLFQLIGFLLPLSTGIHLMACGRATLGYPPPYFPFRPATRKLERQKRPAAPTKEQTPAKSGVKPCTSFFMSYTAATCYNFIYAGLKKPKFFRPILSPDVALSCLLGCLVGRGERLNRLESINSNQSINAVNYSRN